MLSGSGVITLFNRRGIEWGRRKGACAYLANGLAVGDGVCR
jgi:hypothetical protein